MPKVGSGPPPVYSPLLDGKYGRETRLTDDGTAATADVKGSSCLQRFHLADTELFHGRNSFLLSW